MLTRHLLITRFSLNTQSIEEHVFYMNCIQKNVKNFLFDICISQLSFFILRDLGTTQFFSKYKNFLATIFVMKK